jgi:hypothetical protein
VLVYILYYVSDNLAFEQDIHVGVVRKVFEGWVQESS